MKAILLAAGMGTRLRPLTENTPKSLIEINGEPLLERQIKFLNEIGIDEIYVLTGYLSEKFEYLKSKFNINLIHNKHYDKYNNIYSMYLAKNFLGDSYVIDADVYLTKNFLKNNLKNSVYFSGKKNTVDKEWKINFDEDKRIYDIEVTSGENYILSGISYWSSEDSKIIKEILDKLENRFGEDEIKNLYWDNLVKENLEKLNVYVEKIDSNDWYEIDNLKELEELQNKLIKSN